MLRSVDDILGMRIHATDGDIGHVHDTYLDDRDWRVRYLQVDTRHWLSGRHVLLAPSVVRSIDWDGGRIHVAFTREQVQTSPDIDSHTPMPRQHEASEYFEWPFASSTSLWEGEELAARLHAVLSEMRGTATTSPAPTRDDPHLWSTRALRHLGVDGESGDVGRTGDLLIDPEVWTIRYLVIDHRGPFHAHRLFVPMNAVDSISPGFGRVRVTLGHEGNTGPDRPLDAVGEPDRDRAPGVATSNT